MLTALTISFSFLLLFLSPVPNLFNDSFMWLWCYLPDIKDWLFFWYVGFFFAGGVCIGFCLFVWDFFLVGVFGVFFALELQLFPSPSST